MCPRTACCSTHILLNTPEHFYHDPTPTACVTGNGQPGEPGRRATNPATHTHTHTPPPPPILLDLSFLASPWTSSHASLIYGHAGPRDQREGPDVHICKKGVRRAGHPVARDSEEPTHTVTCRPPSIYLMSLCLIWLVVSTGANQDIRPTITTHYSHSKGKLRLTRPARDCPLPPYSPPRAPRLARLPGRGAWDHRPLGPASLPSRKCAGRLVASLHHH